MEATLIEAPLSESPSFQASTTSPSATSLDANRIQELHQLNEQFATAVVIPTYQTLVETTSQLTRASNTFSAAPSEATLSNLETAWMDTQSAWAAGIAFEFGPVHSLGYGRVIAFPTDTAGLTQLLETLSKTLSKTPSETSSETSSETEAVDSLSTTLKQANIHVSLKGLGAIEHIIYSEGQPRLPDSFSATERAYLIYLAADIQTAASGLLSVWQVGWNGYPPYATVLGSAGNPDNGTYISAQAGTEEIIRGLVNSLDVIVNEELPALLEDSAEDPAALTQHSAQLRSLSSTLAGIQLAYRGYQPSGPISLSELRTRGLSSIRTTSGLAYFIRQTQEQSHQQIQQSLTTAIEQTAALQQMALQTPAVAATPEAAPDPATGLALTTTIDALTHAKTILETEVLVMVQD
ncbi:MAG: imelysin family protein [Cyanobacteria bacterium J06560_2]